MWYSQELQRHLWRDIVKEPRCTSEEHKVCYNTEIDFSYCAMLHLHAGLIVNSFLNRPTFLVLNMSFLIDLLATLAVKLIL